MVKKILFSEYRTKINKEELSLKKEQSLPTNKDKGEDDQLKEEYEIEDSKKEKASAGNVQKKRTTYIKSYMSKPVKKCVSRNKNGEYSVIQAALPLP